MNGILVQKDLEKKILVLYLLEKKFPPLKIILKWLVLSLNREVVKVQISLMMPVWLSKLNFATQVRI